MKRFFLFFMFLLSCNSYSQAGFVMKTAKNKIEVPFQHIYNLIIIPVEINNVKVNMLLDTGAESSLIFSLSEKDSIEFYHPKKVNIKGLGSEKSIEALQSDNNKINISGFTDSDFSVLIVLNQDVNFSSRLGIPVNGILGYSFFKRNLIEINYQKKMLTIYKERTILEKKKIKKYAKLPLNIIDQRPYVDVETKIGENEFSNLKLLIDIGLGDGLWLFENDKIKSNDVYFEDILGRGLNGDVIGKKSRVSSLKIGGFTLDKPLVSFPYKAYIPKIGVVSGRNGSLGGEILHRFNLILDYEGKNLYLKKNDIFDKPFNYNMSGIEVEHNGIEYVQESIQDNTSSGMNYGEKSADVIYRATDFKFKFSLKPVFQIVSVRKDSPADLVGILPKDKILKINKKTIHSYTLQKIMNLFQSEEGKWIYIDIERNGNPIAFKFQLKKII